MAHVIAMCTAKGGVGKTTISVNFAAALALRGKKVLIIDNDPQGNSTIALGVDPYELDNGTLTDVVIENTPIADVVVQVQENLSVVPTDMGYFQAEAKAEALEKTSILYNNVSDILGEYDYVVIDCPPSIGFFTVNALRFANSMFIPFHPQRFSIKGMEQIVRIYDQVKFYEKMNPNLEFFIVPSIVDKREKLQNQYLTETEEAYGLERILPGISKSSSLHKSVASGTTIFEYDKSDGAKSRSEFLYLTDIYLEKIGDE